VVFTTNLTGYQEVFTDPSYTGQIVTMTAPMIGNYGINEEDLESSKPQVEGIVVRELSQGFSNWRASGALDEWLAEVTRHGAVIVEGPTPGPISDAGPIGTFMFVRHPDGHLFEYFQPNGG